MMKGYHKNPKATKEVFVSNGWLRTGDIGYYNEGEHFFVTDRYKELIKVKGFQVAPAELEELLRDHPAVEDAAVVGVPHPDFGEVPKAFVVPRKKTAKYKQLIGGVVTIDVDKLKAQILINSIGFKYYQLPLYLTSPETPRDKTYSELVTLIENHLCPQPNECIEQDKFLSRMQAANEIIAQKTVALRKLSSTCNFVCPEPTCKTSIAQVFLQAQFIKGTILFEIDTGSTISIISEQVFREACPNVNLNPSAMTFRTFTGEVFKPLGIAKVQISYENKTSEEDIYVISASSSPLLDRKFTLVTDNKLLCHIFSPKKKLPEMAASRLLRYALFLSRFGYEIKYRRSQERENADY
ncbi:hypothetical protein ILUMI_22982 [Ignelater luminosus]|uniref:AMP-binding enzyme C-terminal domain-containing protein n=1 Tax=Ignelater luminosus TaxID=2038154 RepID=A0A8K0CFK0_IGNLU|nr:hypothetical protein ILUMI_22982 [Ignelater luminosus]